MPVDPKLASRVAHRPLPPLAAACALLMPLVCAASLANCTSDDGAAPSCANGGFACFDGATFDAAGQFPDATPFAEPDGATSPNDSGQPAPDAATEDAAAPPAGDASDAASLSDAAPADDASPIDAGPQPTKLATVTNPYYLTVGGGFVYWSANYTVSRVSVNGGAVTTVAATYGATAMAADATNAYWIGTDGYVHQVAHTSTTAITIGTLTIQSSVIVTDGHYVYWTEDGIESSVFRVPIGGGDAGPMTPTVLEYPSGITFAGGATYVAISNSGEGTAPGTISVLPGDGGLPVPLVTGRMGPQQLTTDGARLYWVEDTGLTPDGIFSSAFDGGALFTFTQDELHPKIVIDGKWLYYSDTEYVLKRPSDGSGTVTRLYTTGYPWAIGQDTNNLYWADRTANAIYRGAKY